MHHYFRCNLERRVDKKLTVIAHNLSNYDLHFLVEELCKANEDNMHRVNVLPKTILSYISLSTPEFRFIDSYRHLQNSLDKLVSDLSVDQFKNVSTYVREVLGGSPHDVRLLSKKSVFCYDYVTSFESLRDPIPNRAQFRNELTNSEVSDSDWSHLQQLISRFGFQTVGDLLQHYNKLDVLLTADVWNNYRSWSWENFGLESGLYVSGPSISWDSLLRTSRARPQLLKDVDMLQFIELGIRGGIAGVMKRADTANNPKIPSYDPSKPTTHIMFLDAVNLYGLGQMGKLPYNDFKWITEKEKLEDIAGWLTKHTDGDRGYIMSVDIEIDDEFHDFLNDYPPCPQSLEINQELISKYSKDLRSERGQAEVFTTQKLAPNLISKVGYIGDLENIQLFSSLGCRVTKIRRILSYHQKDWLKEWVLFNAEQRRLSTSESRSQFHKNAVNFIYGKSVENTRKYRSVVLVARPDQHLRQVGKSQFKRFNIISPRLVAVELEKNVVCMDKPIYLGFKILERSKYRVYDFFYNVLKANLKNTELILTDTDSLLVKFESNDYVEDLKRIAHEFDFSTLPTSHPLFDISNKGVPGKFKDEVKGSTITSVCALRTKLYSIEMLTADQNGSLVRSRKCAGSGIKKHLFGTPDASHEAFVECLRNKRDKNISQKTFVVKKHQVYTAESARVGLTAYDDKRYILGPEGVQTLAYGHWRIKRYGININSDLNDQVTNF